MYFESSVRDSTAMARVCTAMNRVSTAIDRVSTSIPPVPTALTVMRYKPYKKVQTLTDRRYQPLL